MIDKCSCVWSLQSKFAGWQLIIYISPILDTIYSDLMVIFLITTYVQTQKTKQITDFLIMKQWIVYIFSKVVTGAYKHANEH